MRVLFLTRYYYPHTGGVEKHIYEVSQKLKLKNIEVTVLTEKYADELSENEVVNGINVVRFSYPKIKFLGLIFIWIYLFRNISLIKRSDIVHAHDISIWYLPFRFLFPNKPFYSTFHGWEGVYPIPFKNIFIRRLSARISWKNICAGRYIEKYYGIKADFITYGAINTTLIYINVVKNKKRNNKNIVFVGRLERDTGLLEFLKWLGKNKNYQVDFCGDGSLKNIVSKYGTVLGFVDPKKYLKKASYCVPGGYLSALEAISLGCKIKVFWDNPVKRDYWKLSPFLNKGVKNWVYSQTWEKLTNKYLELWNTIQ